MNISCLSTRGRCRNLRKDQTDAESKLWSILRNRRLKGAKFRRQFPVDKFILDFYSSEYKIGIEIDGGQHYEIKKQKEDLYRSKYLCKCGIKILRFNNYDILNNLENVSDVILKTLTSP